MAIALGIDTGGTYTDAALLDMATGQVLAGTKALTTHHDLSIGVGNAVAATLRRAGERQGSLVVSAADIDLVGLSTTLATNSIVEGRGSSVCLLLIGYDQALIQKYGFERDLVTPDVVYIRGGHDPQGDQVAPLDLAAVRDAILSRRDRVEAFAVSGYFGVRNPEHELKVRAMIEELTRSTGDERDLPFPVTCGHELTTRLDAVRRATTAALNARLIPLLRDLIASARRTLDELGISAPLMIVKGDGSLMRSEWAMHRPIETILSGPAASVVGAWHLAGRRDVWVVDVGGTTTDIAALRGGRPRLNPEGAQVGGWRTMIEAADVHTVGLGGDSHVRLNGNSRPCSGGLTIGPRRVIPLCLLASEHPEVVDELSRQRTEKGREGLKGQFVLSRRQANVELSAEEADLLSRLEAGPRSLSSLVGEMRYGPLVVRQLDRMASRGLLLRSAFTPTDALHVLGRFERWDARASRLGAELLAQRAALTLEALCEQVVAEVSDRVTAELVSKVLADEVRLPDWEQEPSAVALLTRAMGKITGSALDCELTLRQPVVAVGAPVAAYLPRTTRQLRTELVIPPHADIANAIGSVAGGVILRQRVLIRPIEFAELFRVHLPDGVQDFATLEDAVAHAHRIVPGRLRAMARQAGADHVEIQIERDDLITSASEGKGQEVFIETQLTFVAAGRPSLA